MIPVCSTSHRALLWLGISLLIAAGLRVATLHHLPLWYDEWLSWMETAGYALESIPDHGRFTKRELDSRQGFDGLSFATLQLDRGNGIIYAAALKGWIAVFGSSIFSLRMLSVLLGLLVVLFGRALSAELRLGHRCQVITSFVMAASPFLIIYSRQARSYILATALVLLATLILFRWLRSEGRKSWMLAGTYGLTIALAGLSHYSTLPIALAHVLILLFWPAPEKPWLTVSVALAACTLPLAAWMLHGGFDGVLRMMHHSKQLLSDLALTDKVHYSEATTLASVMQSAIGQLGCVVGYPGTYIGMSFGLLASLLAIPAALCHAAWRKEKSADRRRAVIVLVLLALAAPASSIIAAVLAGHTMPISARYAVFSAPFACMLIAWAISVLSETRTAARLRGVHPLAAAHAIAIAAFLPMMHGDVHRTGSFEVQRTADALNAIDVSPTDTRFDLMHRGFSDALCINLLLNDQWIDVEQRVTPETKGHLELYAVDSTGRRLILAW